MGEKIIKIINLIIESLLDIIYPYPNKCINCNIEGYQGLCPICKSKIKRCEDFDGVLAYGYYGGILKKLILEFKYNKDFYAGKVLADLLFEIIDINNIDIDTICFVPMDKKSEKRRGFNQCEVLASILSKKINITLNKSLIKVKNTKVQKTLSKEERVKNIAGAFDIKDLKDLNNKNILLIDDVYTTGSTINECKNTIEKCNINKIYLLTIAKSNI